jgi:hypothetical protein
MTVETKKKLVEVAKLVGFLVVSAAVAVGGAVIGLNFLKSGGGSSSGGGA